MKILGIETSCDETAAAVVEKSGASIRVLSNVVSSQIEIHKKYGGVVPEVAAREHVLDILPVIHEALKKAEIQVVDTSGAEKDHGVDAIAVTIGPGLITSLLSGVETAKALAFAWDLPVIGVNHIEGHIAANYIVEDSAEAADFGYPVIILTVSGGHTMLVLMDRLGGYRIIGETRDDAAGEAFDKAASLLGVGYPGGPAIAALAGQTPNTKYQIPKNPSSIANHQSPITKNIVTLPRPMIDTNDFNFSFSGLKTALRYAIERDAGWQKKIPEYCAEFQQAVVDVLVHKTIKAAKKFGARSVLLAGGVSANLELRKQLGEKIKANLPDARYQIPDTRYTTDNAAMIAAAGIIKAESKEYTPWPQLKVECNLGL